MKGEGMDKVREALAELVAATDPRGDTPVEGWKSAWRKAREALSAQPAEPVAYGYPNSAITGRNRWMMLRESIPEDDQYGGAMWVPLFAAPQPAPSKPAAWVACAERMPASGVTVLACYTNSAGNVRRIRAEWVAAKTIESDADSEISEYDEATDCYYDPEGWYEKIDNWGDYSSVAVVEGEITHWMPLPAAPHPAAKGGAE